MPFWNPEKEPPEASGTAPRRNREMRKFIPWSLGVLPPSLRLARFHDLPSAQPQVVCLAPTAGQQGSTGAELLCGSEFGGGAGGAPL